MKRSLAICCMLLLLALAAQATRRNAKNVHVIGNEVKDFALPATSGHTVGMKDFAGAKGFIIVFTCNHCPFAKLYTARFNALSKKYAALGVPFIAINPMDSLLYEDETLAQMAEKAKAGNYAYPYLQDATQQVAKAFAALHTPAAYVVWKEDGKWIIRYSGAIDDNGENPALATPFVANAVDELLDNKPVSKPETLSLGCAINYR